MTIKKKYIKPEINEIPEIWKVCYESKLPRTHKKYVKYEISNLGNIKYNGKLVKPYTTKNYGYLVYKFCAIHRAVAELFIPNPEGKPEVDHIDGNKYNNKYYNLRWVTHKENINNPITKRRRSEALKGKNQTKKSEETRKKMTESKKGEKNPMFGKRGKDSPLYGKQSPNKDKHRVYHSDGSYHYEK